MKCHSCSKGCELTISMENHGSILVEGALCHRGERYALEILKENSSAEDLAVYKGHLAIKQGYRSHLLVTSDRPISKAYFPLIDQAFEKIELTAPIIKGQLVYEDPVYLEIRVLASMGMKARKDRKAE